MHSKDIKPYCYSKCKRTQNLYNSRNTLKKHEFKMKLDSTELFVESKFMWQI